MSRPSRLVAALSLALALFVAQPSVSHARPLPHVSPVLASSPDDYSFQLVADDGSPGRWDPCVVISWRMYKPGAPPGALALLKKDFKKLAQATGMTFEYRGYAPRSAVKSGGNGIVVAFMPRSSMLTVDGVPDASGATAVSGFQTSGNRVVFTGAAVTLLRGRFSPKRPVSVWEPVILHELAHAVGLDHVESTSQVMHSYEGSFRSYQPGDLAGLKLLGREAGCNPVVQ